MMLDSLRLSVPLLGAAGREQNDFLVGTMGADRLADDEADGEPAEVGDGGEQPAERPERIDDVRLEAAAVDHANVLRKYLGADKQRGPEQHGKDHQTPFAEKVDAHGADDHRADAVHDGVEREDGRDGLVEVGLEPLQGGAAARAGFLEGLDFGHGRAQNERLEERAGEGTGEGEDDDGGKPGHGASLRLAGRLRIKNAAAAALPGSGGHLSHLMAPARTEGTCAPGTRPS